MMTRFLAVLAAVAAAAAMPICVPAAEPTLKSVHLGESIYGPPVTADQLQDTVVFVEHWGIH